MKKRCIAIVAAIAALVTAVAPRAYAQYDDIYVTPEQNKTWQKDYKEKEAEREKQREEERKRRAAQAKKEAYLYDAVDENGFSEYEIDAYNRRNGAEWDGESARRDDDRKLKVKAKKKKKAPGRYANRIRRFHSDDAIVIVEGDRVYIIDEDGYCGGDGWGYDDYDDTTVNIFVGVGSGWGGYPRFGFSWYDSWFDPWYDPWFSAWYDPFYPYYRRHYRPWYWSPWGWGSWGWGRSPWRDGYHWGYNDGFWDGYYWGSSGGHYYDPYSGSYYRQPRAYSQGRRSSEVYGARHNQGRYERGGSVSSSGRRSDAYEAPSRNRYARGNYWTSSESRVTDNTYENNYGYGREGRVSRNERGVFGENGQGRVVREGDQRTITRTGVEVNPTRSREDRGVFRASRNQIERQERLERQERQSVGRDRRISTEQRRDYDRSPRRNSYERNRSNYEGGRNSYQRGSSSTYRSNRNATSSSSSRSSESYRSSRSSSTNSSSGSYNSDRSSSSRSSSTGSTRNSTSRRR